MRIKIIKDYPNYSITDSGQVWSRIRDKWLKPFVSNSGYNRIHFGKSGNKSIHRLVLETFVGVCPDGMDCRYKDGNKLNNNLENLRWGTKSENSLDTIKHNIHPTAKLDAFRVRNIKKLLLTGVQQNIIAEMYDVHYSTISYINTGKTWKYIK